MEKVEAISVVGLGKLGLCAAACFADKGYKVIGVDIDRNKIDLINRGQNPIEETGLTQLIRRCRGRLKATTDYREAVLNSQVTFIVVATPSEANGFFSNRQLEQALIQIGSALKNKEQYHLVVITSTVMPGTTEKLGRRILEETSGKNCGEGFGLAYNPEFIALGSVIHDFLNPDFILIGQTNQKDGEILENIYRNVCENVPHFARMNPVNAEIAKLSLNCYVTMKITFANSLAEICERVEGADAGIITSAIGMDSRIGVKYLKPGLGYGGPCFPRDNVAFAAFSRKVNTKAKLAEMVDEVNRDQISRIVTMIKDIAGENKTANIAVLGLSYKPNTPIIEASQAIDIVKNLADEGYSITVYDPQALTNAKTVLVQSVGYAKNIEDCIEDSDVCLIAAPWHDFTCLGTEFFNGFAKKPFILDLWGLLRKNNLSGLGYKTVGCGPNFESRRLTEAKTTITHFPSRSKCSLISEQV
jgi:UDPglucose 6-dehydrogenase